MNNIKKMFAEFKSIFVSENLLEENEQHANIVTAATMLNLFWLLIIVWLLTFFNVFKIGIDTMNVVAIGCFIFLAIPSIICYINKGKPKWVKHLLFISLTIMLAMVDAMLKYNATLVMAIPIILSARYYNKSFTLSIAILTTLLFASSTLISLNMGQQDINTYNLIIPENTAITINGTLREAITDLNIDQAERLKNIFIHFFLPKCMMFNILAFACVQIAQSGRKMVEKQKEISKKGERIVTELNLAAQIQKSMLPSIFPPFPEHKEIDIYASMTPAKEVGGDFYDMFLIDDNHLGICMADVSGKGVPASLVMMISKILIKNITIIDAKADKAMTRVNNMLCDGNKMNLFITCWFGILDLRNGKIEFVNAGHNPPLVYSNKTGKYEYLKTKPNMVLAAIEDTQYRKYETQIEHGDKLFLYTDGVVEASDKDDKLYGEERLKAFLDNHSTLNAEETIISLKKDIDEFVGDAEQFDDITMLELIYKEPSDEEVKIEKEFKAEVSELHNVQELVKTELEKADIDSKTISQIELAVEEVFVNIANYAYENNNGNCLLTIIKENDTFTFVFEDNGIRFNPLEKQDPDITLPIEERKIGGLGIFLTKKIMDKVEYQYNDNKNILIISKKV